MFQSAEGLSETTVKRSSAAQIHDWYQQPPKLLARDIARTAGVDPEPTADVNPLLAALSVPVRSWEIGSDEGGATDERGADDRWEIIITIAGQHFSLALTWQVRRSWKRWLVSCGGCDRWKRALFLVGGRLLCWKCGGVRASESACPAILKPVRELTRAEAKQIADRQYRKDRRKFARIAGAQVFPGGSVGCKVAQTFPQAQQGQTNDGDADD